MGSIDCGANVFVGRQLSFNTDPGIPSVIPGGEGKCYTEYFMTLEPENERYNASVIISYLDLSKPQDIYTFIPSLRRAQRVASSARCSKYSGADFTPDEYRYGFNANLTQMNVDFTGTKKILERALLFDPGGTSALGHYCAQMLPSAKLTASAPAIP
jgi:hypothetical protein